MDKTASRLRLLALLVALMFVALSTRLWFLQVLAVESFAEDARNNSVRFVYSEPLRGLILDASGDPLVANRGAIEVRVNRDELGDDAEAIVLRLSDVLGLDASTLRERLQDDRYFSYQAIPIASFVDTKPEEPGATSLGERIALYINEHRAEFPGVQVVPVSVRSYPEQHLAAHLVGYVGLIQAEDYERLQDKGYGQNDVVGRAGLEEIYERFLRGEKGRQKFIVNADGDVIRALGVEPAQPGSSLSLTLEIDDQRAAEEALADGMVRARSLEDTSGGSLRANAGVVIVMDAESGGIRAMASLPSFNPAWYVKGLTAQQADYLENSSLAPSLNRAIQNPYTPGSTFKAITSLVAVNAGVASLSGGYDCSSTYTHPGDTSETVFTNWAPSDTYMSLHEALRVSCDTVFYRFGSEFYSRFLENQLGVKGHVLQGDLRSWGFGAPTGIDLPFEAGGLVPDSDFAASRPDLYPFGWSPGGDILTMIGAGDISATPLQMARAYAAIANGGRLCRPHLVDQLVSPDGTIVRDPGGRCDRTLGATGPQLDYVRSALASVVSSGTASCAFNGFPLSSIPVMGKTGTAERGTPKFQDTSWFGAMVAPPGEPAYVVMTMVEQGGFGGQVAAPITRDVIERIEGLDATESPRLGCAVLVEDG